MLGYYSDRAGPLLLLTANRVIVRLHKCVQSSFFFLFSFLQLLLFFSFLFFDEETNVTGGPVETFDPIAHYTRAQRGRASTVYTGLERKREGGGEMC